MSERDARAPAIGDYGVVGDCGSVALISRDGSVDWLCWPTFASPSIFARILDPERGGAFAIHPAGPARASRGYVDRTNVLETRFRTDGGVLRVRDAMVAAPAQEHQGVLWPEHQLLREVECVEGEVEVEVRCTPRFDYGRRRVPGEDRGPHGVVFQDGGLVLVLRSEIPLQRRDGNRWQGRMHLRRGERRYVSLSCDTGEPATLPPLGNEATRRLGETLTFWRSWADRCDYDGPYRDAVVRSALTLKLLTVSTSGAVVAAPTTSLPEWPGGMRNWDYRYCWLRDAAFTLHALLELGYTHEGAAFLSWLLHTTRQTVPKLHVMYGVYGSTELDESELDALAGHHDSRPVRIGNGAAGQLQLDLYGSLVHAVAEYVQRGGHLGSWQERLLERLSRAVADLWDQPDNGIWEIRGEKRRHTLSAAMCGVALQRLLEMEAQGELSLRRAPLERALDDIRRTVELRGVDREHGGYASVFDGDDVDASLLLMALYGYEPADSLRMRRTLERVQERLGRGVLLYRYPLGDDGMSCPEGAFGICSFWAVELLAMQGRVGEARAHYEKMLTYGNDLGLFSEEIHPESGAALGNFPQAFTHVGVINAALAIDRALGQREARRGATQEDVSELHGRQEMPEDAEGSR